MRVSVLMIGCIATMPLACSESSGDGAGDVVDAPAVDQVALDATVSDIGLADAYVDALADLPYDGWWPDAYRLPDLPARPTPDVADDFPLCEPSSYVDCACGDGGAGYQVCTDRGVWMRCTCEGAVAPATGLPPRLIAPLSNLRVTSQRPTLRWELPAGVTRARVELCEDRLCARRITQAEVTGTSWRSPTPLRPGVVFWRMLGLRDDGSTAWTSATWEFGVRHRDTPVDTAWGSLKDFDGDGYDDLLVRVERYYSEQVHLGYLLYRGRPEGLELVPASRITGRAGEVVLPCEHMQSVATSDLNRDGLADAVLVCDSGTELYLGTRTGEVLRSAGRLTTSDSIELVDMDGDGDDDIFCPGYYEYQVYVYTNESGSFDVARIATTRGSQVNGLAPATSGDVDGDGYGDGILYLDRPEVFYGSPAIDFPRRSLTQRTIGAWPDRRTASFGVDLDADGRMDLVSSVLLEHHSFNRQLVLVRSEIILTRGCESANVASLSRPGDVDGDGWPEFGTATYCLSPASTALAGSQLRLLRSGPSGISLTPTWTQAMDGPAFAGIPGDLNGDGFDDVVIATAVRLQVLYGAERTLMAGATYPLPDSTYVALTTSRYPLF